LALYESDTVRAAQQGDEAAWELLYRRLYPRVQAYFARRLGGLHAEDAVSETMARAVRGIDRFVLGPAGFDGWVFGIARRVAADHYRRAAQLQRQDVAAARLVGGAGGLAERPDDGLITADDEAQLRRLFGRLSEGEQEILELRVIAGLTAEQVAAVLGRAPGAVRTAQSRALARLRRLMAEDDE
jgi:RNA polymerase sigma-70 factor, ECF subfamily